MLYRHSEARKNPPDMPEVNAGEGTWNAAQARRQKVRILSLGHGNSRHRTPIAGPPELIAHILARPRRRQPACQHRAAAHSVHAGAHHPRDDRGPRQPLTVRRTDLSNPCFGHADQVARQALLKTVWLLQRLPGRVVPKPVRQLVSPRSWARGKAGRHEAERRTMRRALD